MNVCCRIYNRWMCVVEFITSFCNILEGYRNKYGIQNIYHVPWFWVQVVFHVVLINILIITDVFSDIFDDAVQQNCEPSIACKDNSLFYYIQNVKYVISMLLISWKFIQVIFFMYISHFIWMYQNVDAG